jgi:hypothetical protein
MMDPKALDEACAVGSVALGTTQSLRAIHADGRDFPE